MTEKEVINLLSRLRFIGKIQPGDKLDVGSSYIYRNDLRTKLIRSTIRRNESRTKTLKYIQDVMYEAFDILDTNFPLKDLIKEGIRLSRSGLVNLMITYDEDGWMVSELESLIKLLDVKLS